MNKSTSALLMVLLITFASTVEAKRILFYEVGATYTMEAGYSKFAKELQAKGYEIASITRGDLTKESLETYDILILPGVSKGFTPEETSAIVDFVSSRGRGLFISGITGSQQLVVPLGVTMDSGTLIDTTNQIPNMDKNSFTIERFNEYPGMSSIRQGITKIGFYSGSGIRVSGTSRVIATGDADTHSDTGSFPPGSYPPVIAASMYGNGLVFMTVDSKFLSDQYIDDYNNKRLGLNIIDWLSISTDIPHSQGNTTQELQYIIAEQKLELAQLKSQVEQLTAEKADLLNQVSSVSEELSTIQQQLFDIQSSMIGPLSKTNWTIIALGVCILAAAIIFSKRKQQPAKVPKDEDILGELGYELEKPEQKQSQIPTDINKLESELDNIKL